MPEYNDFAQEGYIVDSEPRRLPARSSHGSPASRPGLHQVKTFILVGAGSVTAIVVGVGVFTVHQFLPVIGVLALLVAILLLLCVGAYAVITVVRHATRADYYGVEEFGGYMRDSLGRVRPLAPMSVAPARVSKATNKVEITPAVPTLFDLIENGDIALSLIHI